MTLKEVAYLLGKSEKTIQDILRKRGIILTKWGVGKDAEYEERDEEE